MHLPVCLLTYPTLLAVSPNPPRIEPRRAFSTPGVQWVGVIAEPDLREEILHDDDEFVIVACDGLWDVMSSKKVRMRSSQHVISFCVPHALKRVPLPHPPHHPLLQAVEFARKSLKRHGNPEQASQELSDAAVREGSNDNVSVLILSFIERPGFRWGGRQGSDDGGGQAVAHGVLRSHASSQPFEPRGGAIARPPLHAAGTASPAVLSAPTLNLGARPSPGSTAPAVRPRPTQEARSALMRAMATAGLPATPRPAFEHAWDDESPLSPPKWRSTKPGPS